MGRNGSNGRRGWRVVVAACLIIAAAGCDPNEPKPPDTRGYLERIAADRAYKDKFLATSSDSPVPKSKTAELLPLEYYPIDPDYNVPAALTPSNDTSTIMMPTSAGTADPMRKVGTLQFTLKGQTLTLTAFAPAAEQNVIRLFVPFRDQTSTKETYPGGRYLDLDRTSTGVYQLDFNAAYNPNCYFNVTWICPVPPRENQLPIAVLAGERIKHAK